MSSFTEPLNYESTDIFRGGHLRSLKVEGQETWELVGARRIFQVIKPFSYTCNRTNRVYVIPTGFKCDLGSIPKIATVFLSPDDPWAQAYVLHDYLYQMKIVDRKTADLILWDALKLPYRAYDEANKQYRIVCPSLYRTAIYQSVNLFGSSAYNRQRNL